MGADGTCSNSQQDKISFNMLFLGGQSGVELSFIVSNFWAACANLLQIDLLLQSLCISVKEEEEQQTWRRRRRKKRTRKRKDGLVDSCSDSRPVTPLKRLKVLIIDPH